MRRLIRRREFSMAWVLNELAMVEEGGKDGDGDKAR